MDHRIVNPTLMPLTVNGLSLIRNQRQLLSDISFTLNNEQVSVVLGANGAGKTLLLKLCHGLIQPSKGEISWGEKDPKQIAEKQAMVFQRPVLLKRSAADNINYVLKLKGFDKRQRQQKMQQCLELTGLTHLKNRPARVLSGGEQQRLALARAWAIQPEVLFLDEITANLDPSATALVEQLIELFAASGVKIIMTTHDLNQAKRLADEVLFLHQGRLLEHNSAQPFFEAAEQPAAKAFVRGELLW